MPDWKPFTFVPPENLISEESKDALKESGFSLISGQSGELYDISSQFFDYKTKSLYSAHNVWDQCQTVYEKQNICVVMTHPQEFVDNQN